MCLDQQWEQLMTAYDKRALTPLFWSNVALHGTFTLDRDKSLDYEQGAQPAM